MAPRFLSLALALLGLSGLAVTVACGGGGGDASGDPESEPSAPSSTPLPRNSRGFEPASSTTPTVAPGSGELGAGSGGPEGAVSKITTRSRTFNSENGGTTSPVSSISFVAPLNYWDRILEPFGTELGNSLFHGGIDFGLDGYPNAPVYAACDGWVAGLLSSDGYGTYIVIKCDESQWTTVYAQLGETLVRLNDVVSAGKTMIARSGGRTRWGHEMLHFELRWDFVSVDPAVHIAFNVRPSFTLPPDQTPEPSPTSTPLAGENPDPSSVPAGPTAIPTATPTPTATPWWNPTATPKQPTPTPTRVPTRTPIPTPTIGAPTSTPVPPPQAF